MLFIYPSAFHLSKQEITFNDGPYNILKKLDDPTKGLVNDHQTS